MCCRHAVVEMEVTLKIATKQCMSSHEETEVQRMTFSIQQRILIQFDIGADSGSGNYISRSDLIRSRMMRLE
jgi:hypothetical protein